MPIDLPKFRYASDFDKYIRDIARQVEELDKLADLQKKVLAKHMNGPAPLVTAEVFTMSIGEDDGDAARRRMRSLKKKIDPNMTKVVIPDQKTLAERYGLAEELYEKYRTLEAVEAQMSSQFKGELSKDTLQSIRSLKAKVEQSLQKTLKFLNEIASKHVPKSFMNYVSGISAELESHVTFEKSDTFLYAHVTPKGSLGFTFYVMMVNAINEDGTTIPTLYAAVQWIVGSKDEDSQVLVYLTHEFEQPNQLLASGAGEEADTVISAVKALAILLSMEHFSSELGVVPLALQFLQPPSRITKNLFSTKDMLDTMTVDGNEIRFILKGNIPQEQVNKIAQQLYLETKQLIKHARTARLRMKITKQGRKSVVSFFVVNLAGPGDISLQDAEYMKDKYGVDDVKLRRIVKILNEGN